MGRNQLINSRNFIPEVRSFKILLAGLLTHPSIAAFPPKMKVA
jgi:hypothetical protein